MQTGNYKIVLSQLKSIRATVENLNLITLETSMNSKVQKLKIAVADDDSITSESTLLTIRKLLESFCQDHHLYKYSYRMCSQFCHDLTDHNKDASLDDVQRLVYYLWIMMTDMNPSKHQPSTPPSSSSSSMFKYPEEPQQQHIKIQYQPKVVNAPPIAESNDANMTVTHIKSNGFSNSNEKRPRKVMYPHLRCKLYPNCYHGDNCAFAHGEDEYLPADCLKTQVCNYWRKGICIWQNEPEKCGFAHGAHELKQGKKI